MTEQSAPPVTPPQSDSAANNALIQQIMAEARSSGRSITFDPDAPPEAAEDTPDAPETKPSPKGKPPAKPPEKESDEDSDETPVDPEEPTEAEDGGESIPVEIDLEAVKGALDVEGKVDILALAAALGKSPEDLGVTPATHAALRVQQRKAKAMIEKATKLGQQLNAQYGDQVAARRAAEAGQLEPAISFVENTFGMSWNELNKMVAGLLAGKPAQDLDGKRELRELKKREAERAEAEKKQATETAQKAKVTEAKQWIATSIKGDKLATAELNRQLEDAGFPTITDLVFDEMQANYSKGLTDPKKALERVKIKLTKQARALQATGLIAKPIAPKPKPTTSSRPRADAQTGAAGNGRPMTDKELREAVLKEAGLWR